jgi:hypothetical protein
MLFERNAYRFAAGDMKGRPLDDIDPTWELSFLSGKPVALFSNGRTEEFVIDTCDASTGHGQECDRKSGHDGPHGPGSYDTSVSTAMTADPVHGAVMALVDPVIPVASGKRRAPSYRNRKPDWPQLVDQPRGINEIVRYKLEDGSNPMIRCQPVYGVSDLGGAPTNYSREVVGTGLREFLWIYDKLRAFGRGPIHALLEARQIFYS